MSETLPVFLAVYVYVIVSPASVAAVSTPAEVVGKLADLVDVREDDLLIVVLAEELGEVVEVPSGLRPDAVAVLVTPPAIPAALSTSACEST